MGDNFCKAPDRHEPKLVCGYPLPCPHHTVFVVIGEKKSKRSARGKEVRTLEARPDPKCKHKRTARWIATGRYCADCGALVPTTPSTGADGNGRTAKQRLRARNRKRVAEKAKRK